MLLEGRIGVGHVCSVVLVVVDLHRPRVDVRLERVECVRKLGQLKWHFQEPPLEFVSYVTKPV